jgi:thiosulfate/3-mercaptopyruvate sulfurtransferase
VLASEYSQLLAGRPPRAVVHQCGSGVTACHNLLAMEWAGLGGSQLYPGSWSEWCADAARPVATGS